MLLLQGRRESLNVLRTEVAEGRVHEQLLADNLGQCGLLIARVANMTAGQLTAHSGTWRGRTSAGATAAISLRYVCDLGN